MILHLARHGTTTAEGFFLGSSDPPLSEAGRLQSEELAARLEGRGVERIVSSGLRRAAETADIVGRRLGLPVERDARFNEIGYGAWDGLPWTEIERRWPDEAQRKLGDWWGVVPPGGEPADAFFERLRAGLEELRSAGRSTVLVAHLAVNGLIEQWAGSGKPALAFEQPCGASLALRI